MSVQLILYPQNYQGQFNTITISSHTRKTKANDRLIQYTFNIEVDKTKQSQLM